jgi:release factor glutamine methyltransferase
LTIQTALTNAKQTLANSSTPLLDAELILCHVLQIPRTKLITQPNLELETDQEQQFNCLLEERCSGKPMAYITHEKEFFGRSFFVDERVLIPRPETEEMVEDALKFLKANPELKTVIDLGTGSGAIAITVANELPDRQVIGLEISAEALEVAEINHQRYQCRNLQLFESDLLSSLAINNEIAAVIPVTGLPRNDSAPLTILANLPYIGTTTNRFISEETERYEPHQALFGGSDGLELYRKTWQQIHEQKLNLAALFMEIGFSQAKTMESEARSAFPKHHFEIKNDLAGLPRTAILRSSELK